MADPANQKKVELARTFVFHLLKGIKQIGMYRHNETKFGEFLSPAHQAMVQFGEQFQVLSMKVEQQNFLLLGQPLFTEDSQLPYKFYRDGIRQLLFRPGVTVEELVKFTLIAISEPERGAEDLLAQLWRAAFENIEYVVVESFSVGDATEEEIQVEVDQVVSFLYERLRGTTDDYLRFARVSAEDLDVKMEGIDQIRGAVVGGLTATDELKAKLQREIEEEETSRLFPKLVSAVFEVVEGGVEDATLLQDMFTQVVDALLLQEDFATINQIVLKLRAMEQRSENPDAVTRLRKVVVGRMGEEARLTRVADILKLAKAKKPQDVARYFQALDESALETLLNSLEGIAIAENRQLILDAVAPWARNVPGPFISRLQSDKPQVVRDMVYVLERAQHPDRMRMFGGVLKHKNLAVRLDVMTVIARGRTGESRKLIAECLADPISQVRMLAAKLLPDFDRDKAFADLVKILRDPSFEKKTSEEKGSFYGAIGATGLPQAITLFEEVLSARGSLFNRTKVVDEKLLAIQGLAGVCSLQSYQLLNGLVEDRSQTPEVLSAARKALFQTKKALYGDAGPPTAEGG